MKTPSRKRWLRPALSALALVIIVASWVLFAPSQLGGSAGYVTISGNSMEPQFRKGDLVIVRRAKLYHVGEIVVYDSPIMGTVIHRIVDTTADGFLLKGDNNDWTDSYRPSPEEIIGRYWLRIPSGGNVVKSLRHPAIWTVLILVAGIITLPSAFKPAPAGKPKKGKRTSDPPPRAGLTRGHRHRDVVFLLASVGFATLALGFASWPKPPTIAVRDSLTYDHAGELFYSATVPPNVYDGRDLQPGEPIFRQLTNEVNFTFEYGLISQHPIEATGSYQLKARVSDVNGWKRTFILIPETPFNGTSFSASSTLLLSDIHQVLDEMEAETGLHRGQYQFTILPTVSIEGTLAGIALIDQFKPAFNFSFDSLQVQYIGTSPSSSTPLKPVEAKALVGEHSEPNTLRLLFFNIPVMLAKAIAAGGVALAVIGICVVSIIQARTNRKGQAARIELQYGHLLVDVAHQTLPSQGMAEVSSFEDLAVIAKREGRLILHQVHEHTHDYAVQIGDFTYHYRLGPERAKIHKSIGFASGLVSAPTQPQTPPSPPRSPPPARRQAVVSPVAPASTHPISEEEEPTTAFSIEAPKADASDERKSKPDTTRKEAAEPQEPKPKAAARPSAPAISERPKTRSKEVAPDFDPQPTKASHQPAAQPQQPKASQAAPSGSPASTVEHKIRRKEVATDLDSPQPGEVPSSAEEDRTPTWLSKVRRMASKDTLQGRSWHALSLDEKLEQCGLADLAQAASVSRFAPEKQPRNHSRPNVQGAPHPARQDPAGEDLEWLEATQPRHLDSSKLGP
ncbi:MAG: signal peptidase I [Anaerolineales bacterium]